MAAQLLCYRSPMSNLLSLSVSVSVHPTWTDIVDGVSSGDEYAAAQLAHRLTPGLKHLLFRRVGADIDDLVQETLLIVLDAVTKGRIANAEALAGFARTVAERQAARYVQEAIRDRNTVEPEVADLYLSITDTPESKRAHHERVELMAECLRELNERDRTILTRFYLDEEPWQQICEDMNLTETQFRLLKSRAKARFGELGRKRLTRKPLGRAWGLGSAVPVASA